MPIIDYNKQKKQIAIQLPTKEQLDRFLKGEMGKPKVPKLKMKIPKLKDFDSKGKLNKVIAIPKKVINSQTTNQIAKGIAKAAKTVAASGKALNYENLNEQIKVDAELPPPPDQSGNTQILLIIAAGLVAYNLA